MKDSNGNSLCAIQTHLVYLSGMHFWLASCVESFMICSSYFIRICCTWRSRSRLATVISSLNVASSFSFAANLSSHDCCSMRAREGKRTSRWVWTKCALNECLLQLVLIQEDLLLRFPFFNVDLLDALVQQLDLERLLVQCRCLGGQVGVDLGQGALVALWGVRSIRTLRQVMRDLSLGFDLGAQCLHVLVHLVDLWAQVRFNGDE